MDFLIVLFNSVHFCPLYFEIVIRDPYMFGILHLPSELKYMHYIHGLLIANDAIKFISFDDDHNTSHNNNSPQFLSIYYVPNIFSCFKCIILFNPHDKMMNRQYYYQNAPIQMMNITILTILTEFTRASILNPHSLAPKSMLSNTTPSSF